MLTVEKDSNLLFTDYKESGFSAAFLYLESISALAEFATRIETVLAVSGCVNNSLAINRLTQTVARSFSETPALFFIKRKS